MSQSICEIVPMNGVQAMLDSAFANQNNMEAPETPFLDHIMSEGNRSRSTIKLLTGASKVRGVEIQYDQPLLTSAVNENVTGCVATREECDYVETYDFDETQNIGLDLKVYQSELTRTAEENCAFIARKVQKMIVALKEAQAERLGLFAAASFGKWSQDTGNIAGVNVNGAGILEVNTTLDNGTNARPRNSVLYNQIRTALKISRINGAAIFGGLELEQYLRTALAGGSMDSLGFDLGAMIRAFGLATAYDRYLSDALTSVNATDLAVGLGSIVPVGFAKYDADCNKKNDSSNICLFNTSDAAAE